MTIKDERLNEVESRLRIGQIIDWDDCLYAADVIARYRELLSCSRVRREQIVRAINTQGAKT
jgi:hypothetical protein